MPPLSLLLLLQQAANSRHLLLLFYSTPVRWHLAYTHRQSLGYRLIDLLVIRRSCNEWALQKIEVNRIPNDRLEGVIKTMIKDLEKRKDKTMIRSDTDDLWTKIETLQEGRTNTP
jgi:hypothetical protein